MSRFWYRFWQILFCILLCGLGSGCNRIMSRQLVVPASFGGKFALALRGDVGDLVAGGKIDAHRRVVAGDGAEIDIWVMKSRLAGGGDVIQQRKGTVVVIHPMLASKTWFFTLAERLVEAGWDVVLPDLRAHGASGGEYITWGAKEKHDIKAVVDAVLAEKLVDSRVYVLGASLGGCVAIQYAALDSRCTGVLAIAPSIGIQGAARSMFPLAPGGWLRNTIACAGEVADFDPSNASALDAAKELKCPLILVHGLVDAIVPITQGIDIYEAANEPKKMITQYLANHFTVQIGRDGWIVEQMDVLAEMAAGQ